MKHQAEERTTGTGLGFVVIGRNEGERLRACLQSVLAHSRQVVYVDSRSTDDSCAIAQSLGVQVELLGPGRPTSAARGRNAGARAIARHFDRCEYIQFVDGDCLLEAGWPKEALQFLERNRGVAVVCGRRHEAFADLSIYNWMIDQEWATPIGEADQCGGDFMIRAAAFEHVGGFRDDLAAGEEPEMCARLRAAGWSVFRLDSPMTEHDAQIQRFSQWWNRAKRSGFGYVQVFQASNGQLYRKPLFSALFWAVGVPLGAIGIAVGAGTAWLLILVPLAYGIQVGRMAARKGLTIRRSWMSALVMMASKFAEAAGAAAYFLTGKPNSGFEYKSAPHRGSRQRPR